MAFDPSQSTLPSLAAALADSDNASESIQIAPELMGDAGAAPSLSRHESENGDQQQNDPSDEAQQAFGGYQNSSARDEGYRGWTTPTKSTRSQNPWEEGYQDQQSQNDTPSGGNFGYDQTDASVNAVQDGVDEASKPPRKRARQTKHRDKNGVNENGLPEEGIMDFGHPSGDFKLGPVFVHPPKGVAQACVRCHKIKRKCDNGRPRCAGCSKADVACVFELNPATSSYVSGLKNDNVTLSTQILSASDRISQLETLLIQSGQDIPVHVQPIETANIAAALTAVGDKARISAAKESEIRDHEKRLQEDSIVAGIKRRRMSW